MEGDVDAVDGWSCLEVFGMLSLQGESIKARPRQEGKLASRTLALSRVKAWV